MKIHKRVLRVVLSTLFCLAILGGSFAPAIPIFAAGPWTITAQAGANGTITPSGEVSIPNGSNQTFTITPNSGYHIASLTIDSVLTAPIVSTYTFTNVSANHTISATFATGTQDWPLQLIGASTVNLSKADFETLATAHPSNNYTDSSGNVWKGVALWRLIAMVDDGDPTTFNSSLTSVYSIKLTAADNYAKTIAPSDYAANFVFANSENVFVANKVMLSGTSTWTDLPLTKPTDSTKLWYPTMDTGSGIAVGNMRVAALVKIELLNLPAFTITTSSGSNGTVVAVPVNVVSGGSSTVTITPNSGYHIASLTVDSVLTAPIVSTYTFTNVSANHTVAATFAAGTQDWPLQLVGATSVNMSKADFEALASAYPSNNYTDSSSNVWKGVALWRLIAMVDDGDPTTFNSSLTSVYSIKLTAADGYTKTILPSDYAANFIFANSENVFVANKVMLSGNSTWTDLPLTKPTDSTKLWYPTMDTGSAIAVGNMRVAALVKIELLNLPATNFPVTATVSPSAAQTAGCSVSGTGNYASGSSVNLTANAVTGWTFSGWTSSNITISNPTANPLTFIMPANAVGVTATFTVNTAVSVGIYPATQSINTGTVFNVNVTINTNVASRGWQTNIDFDATKLACNSVTEGTFLSTYASAHSGGTISAGNSTVDNAGGHVTIPGFAISNAGTGGPTGTGVLCVLSFTAKHGTNGSANVTPSSVIISDVNGATISGVTVTGGSISVIKTGNASLIILPPTQSVSFNETFNVDIQAQCNGEQINGVAAYLDFDPAVLQVQSITAVTTWAGENATVIEQSSDNIVGQVNFSAGVLGTSVTGNITVATVTFRAIGASNGSNITFHFAPPLARASAIAGGAGNSVLDTATGASITVIAGATVDISVVLDGGQRPVGGWVVPLTVKFFTPGADVMSDTPVYSFTQNTTKVGSTAVISVSGITPGTYDITAKSNHTLVNVKRNAVISQPTTSVSLGTLAEGNAKEDTSATALIINIFDFSALSASWNKGPGDTGYNANANFDINNIVNIFDFSLLSKNWNKTSPIDIT